MKLPFLPFELQALEFALRAGLATLMLFVAAVVGCFASREVGLGITLATLGFALLAVAQSLSSWRADLVEKRRRLRVFIVGAGALYTLLLHGGQVRELARITDLLALSAIAVVMAWYLVRPSGGQLFWPEPAQPAVVALNAPNEEPLDASLVAPLEALMTNDRIYRQEGVSVAVLAQRLGLPEYKLRRVINQGLGYRNFNAFLNRYRINEVKAALADTAQAPVPVLTLAMDAGFQSLGPFNRAFKAETGLTPTEFRRTRQA